MIGQVFQQRYQITRQVGEGGMSRVYLARQLDQPREVALKVLLPEMAVQAKAREHFRREIFIMSRFQHPHAILYYDADPDGEPPFLVMEYLRGMELATLLERRRRLTPDRAGRLLGQLCDVLHSAHELGIIHRDLKPGNLMVVHPETPVEKIKLMDFGLARMSSLFYIAPEELVNLRQPTASGTPEYISPEQVRGNEVDRRSDIYSVGVILYEMLTGRRPFPQEEVESLLLAHLDERVPRFAELGLGGEIPPEIEQVVQDCLAKYPEERPQTAEELAHRYEAALGRKIYLRARPLSRLASAPPISPSRVLQGQGKTGERLPGSASGLTTTDRHAITHSLTVSMVESMVMIKLKGFIHDVGGEIVESAPGTIRVRLTEEKPAAPKNSGGGLLSWLSSKPAPAASNSSLQMELRMEKNDPNRPNDLTITLVLRTYLGLFTPEGRSRCEKIWRDLQAYLGGR